MNFVLDLEKGSNGSNGEMTRWIKETTRDFDRRYRDSNPWPNGPQPIMFHLYLVSQLFHTMLYSIQQQKRMSGEFVIMMEKCCNSVSRFY